MSSPHLDVLIQQLERAEASEDGMLRDQVAFSLGLVPEDGGGFGSHFNRQSMKEVWLKNCPKLSALLDEMNPITPKQRVLLSWAGYQDREDILGEVCTRLIRYAQS